MDRNEKLKKKIKEAAKVVPYVGTWIEIKVDRVIADTSGGRSLRGNVDRNSV